MTSVINKINTGTSANSGNGDSLRTAFNKINQNFLDLENSYVSSGVASFNGQGGVITFTATQIAQVLGFVPYSADNPNNYVTSAVVQGFAQKNYVDINFVTSSTIALYPKTSYLTALLTEYASLNYLNTNNYITQTTLGTYLSDNAYLNSVNEDTYLTNYATKLYVSQQGFITPETIDNYITVKGNLLPTDATPIITTSTTVSTIGTSTIYLSAVNGISLGMRVDSNVGGIPPNTNVTAIDPVHNTVDISNPITAEIARNTIIKFSNATDTYDLGSSIRRWKEVYLSNAIILNGLSITVDTATNRLSVANNSITSNFTFEATKIYNDDTTFTLNATHNGLAGLTIPATSELADQYAPTNLFNYAEGGVKLSSPRYTSEVNTYVTGTENYLLLTGEGLSIYAPVALPFILGQNYNYLQIEGSQQYETDPNGPPIKFTAIDYTGTNIISRTAFRPINFYTKEFKVQATELINSSTRVPFVGAQTTATMVLSKLGLYLGDSSKGNSWGYTLPLAPGNTGTTLVNDGHGSVSWQPPAFDPNFITVTTASITTSLQIGPGGLLYFGNGSTMGTAYGNDQVGDFLPTYYGVVGVDNIQGLGTNVNINANGLVWNFASDGILTLPAHSRIVFNASNPQQYIEGTQGLHIHASDAVVIDAGAYTWSFGSDGIFTFPDNSTQSGGSISKSDLKALVSTCTNFTDFKNAIAAL